MGEFLLVLKNYYPAIGRKKSMNKVLVNFECLIQ
jgi:hypothetical protein